MLQQSITTRPTARTPEGRLRQKVHQVSRELGLCDDARRGVAYCVVGKRYARDMNEVELTVLVAWLEHELNAERRPAYTAAELHRIVNADDLESLLA